MTMTTTIVGGTEGQGGNRIEVVTKLASSLNDQLDRQIDMADRKAQLILAACTFMAATTAPLTANITFNLFDTSVHLSQRVAVVFTILMMIALIFSVYFSLLVTKPRIIRRRQKQSMLFFADIITWSESEFVEKFMQQQPEDIRNLVLSQAHKKAFIADRKFTGIRHSLNFLFLTFIFWGIAGVLLAFAR